MVTRYVLVPALTLAALYYGGWGWFVAVLVAAALMFPAAQRGRR